MSKITISRLDALLRACGFEFTEGVDYWELFAGPDSPILGYEVNATITDKPDRKEPDVRRQEVGGFTALEA